MSPQPAVIKTIVMYSVIQAPAWRKYCSQCNSNNRTARPAGRSGVSGSRPLEVTDSERLMQVFLMLSGTVGIFFVILLY